jgi:hypothetical protein
VEEVPITQEEIDDLAQQLEGITGDNQRALLSGIVAVAAQAIREVATEGSAEPLVSPDAAQDPPVVVQLRYPLGSLSDQIAQAFTPGAIDLDGGPVQSVKIFANPPT